MSISDKDCAYLNCLVMKHHVLDKLIADTRDLDLEFIRLSGNIEDSGFLAVAFLTNHSKSIVIAHRGTDFFNCKPINGVWKFNGCKKFFSTDFSDDIGIALGNVPEQMVQAETFYTSIFQAYPDYAPICTGYSLGGVYAELLGLRYGVRTTSFDTPGIKQQAESYLSADVVERNKHFITCYKSSPNFINTNGEQYARIIRIEFVTDTFGFDVVDYALYTFVQHDIELLWGYFAHQREVRDWPNGFVAGYNSYLSVAENSPYWEKHIEDLWFKHKFFVDHLPSEMKIRTKKEFAEKFKAKYLHSYVSHMHSKPELEWMSDSLVKAIEKENCLVLNIHRSQHFNEVTCSLLSIIRGQGDYPKKEEDLIPPYSEPLDYLLTNNRLFEAIELIQSGRVDEKALSKALMLTSANSFSYEFEYTTMLLIAANVPLNNTDGDGGMTALHGAARCGSVNTVRMLLAAGADPNLPTRGGWTILHEALLMSSGSEEKMKLIIAAGGNLFAKCETGDNPAECARKMGRTETVDFLLDQMKISGVEGFPFDEVLA